MPFDLFGRNWVENDNHWDEGFVSTPTKSQMGEVDQVERKKGRINIDAKPRHVFGEEKEDLGSNNGGLLKGALHSENSLKGLASELALLLPKDNHSKTVSDILQKVRKGIYQRSLTVKVSSSNRRRGRVFHSTMNLIISCNVLFRSNYFIRLTQISLRRCRNRDF